MNQSAEWYEEQAAAALRHAGATSDAELERWQLATAQVYATLAVAAAIAETINVKQVW